MRLLIALLLISGSSFAQIGTGQWRLHTPSQKAIDVVSTNSLVYAAYLNGVAEYDISAGELSTWDAVSGLSDITISCLGISESNGSVFIGYENGNIDKLKNNGVTNIPAIKLAEVQGSKKIYTMREYDGHIFCATGFAIVKIDPVKDEVRDTYYPTNGNQAIVDVAFRGDTIFALTENLMYHGLLSNIALADPTQWTVDTRVPTLTTNTYKELETVNGELFVLYKNEAFGEDTVYQITNGGLMNTVTESFPPEIRSISEVNGKIAFHYDGATIIYNDDYSYDFVLADYGFGNPHVNGMFYRNGIYWTADDRVGLVELTKTSAKNLTFSGPPKEDFYRMDWVKGRLAVTSGGVSGNSSTFNNKGIYIFEDEQWSLRDPWNMTMWAGASIWDFLTVAMNPADKDKMAVGTFSPVPLSLMNASGQVTDTLTEYNSGIEQTNVGNGLSLVSALEYDNNGHLWVLNGGTNQPLKVYTSDGQWQSFDLGTQAKGKFSDKMVIDNSGNKWFTFLGEGVYGFSDGGTATDLSDDNYVRLDIGQNSGALPSNGVTAIAVDRDNELWIGTDAGFAVLYNAPNAISASPGDYNAQRIKLEFEGNVEYVLGATHITDIVVDGANRKWFGTANSGIILLSPDGLDIVEQHTVENSPLISNNIMDLEIDHNTGELFIITDKGLVSYRTDATQEDATYSNVKVFPNPVRPDYTGPITIQGIRYNSDVKITDAAGNVVYQTTSNGGTATWDGKTLTGNPVTTGVYLIWTAANEGKGRKVGKVLVVR